MDQKPKILLPFLFIFIGTLSFAICNALVKYIGKDFPISMIFFVQSVTSILYLLPWILKSGMQELKTKKLGLQIIRGLAEVVGISALFLSFRYISLANGILLNNLSVLFVPLLLFLLKGVKIQKNLWLGLLIGLLGVTFVLKPDQEIFQWGSILALISGLITGYVLILLNELGKSESSNRINVYCFATCIIVLLPIILFTWQTPSFSQLIFMVLSGVALVLATTFYNHAFRIGRVEFVSPFVYLTVFFGGLFDFFFWNDLPSMITTIGALLIILGGILTIVAEHRNKQLF
jgi:drug/metabolite transporter (DMT)-like permease